MNIKNLASVVGCLAALMFILSGCETAGVTSGERSAEQDNNKLQVDPKNNIASISSVLAKNPRDANALNLRGTAYGQAGDYQKALGDFTAAIQVNAQYYQAYNNRALIYLRMNDLQSALADYNQSITIKPDYAIAYVGRGNVYKTQKSLPAAISDFTKAIELKPDDAAPYYSRGLIYQSMADHQSAVNDLTVAINYRPDAPDPHFARGVSYMEQQNFKKALEDFETAGTNKVNNYEAWANAGQAAEALGDKKTAAHDYKKALQINSSSKIAYEGLRRVGGEEA